MLELADAEKDFGPVQFIGLAVQVIPVLVVALLADEFVRRDIAHPVHRHFVSSATAVGLVFAIAGEVAGFQALLTGSSAQTVSVVDAGLMAPAATVVLPRLAELHVVRYPDVARRLIYRILPSGIATVGFIVSTMHSPMTARVVLVGFSCVSFGMALLGASTDARAEWRRSRDQNRAVKEAVKADVHVAEEALGRADAASAREDWTAVDLARSEAKAAVTHARSRLLGQNEPGADAVVRSQDERDRQRLPPSTESGSLWWLAASVTAAAVAIAFRSRRGRKP